MAESPSNATKIAVLAATALAALAAHKLVSLLWEAAAGHKPPADGDEETGMAEAITAAAVTGAVVGIARVLAGRAAAKTAHALVTDTPADA